MKPIISLCLSVICSSVAFGESGESFQGSQTANKPNVIFILADDLGYGDVGCNGQTKILTPQIDDLAKNGIRNNGYYAPGKGSYVQDLFEKKTLSFIAFIVA